MEAKRARAEPLTPSSDLVSTLGLALASPCMAAVVVWCRFAHPPVCANLSSRPIFLRLR